MSAKLTMLLTEARRQPSIDEDEPCADQGHAGHVTPFQGFAQEENAEQDRADGDEKGHEAHIRRPRPGQQAEEQQIGEGGARSWHASTSAKKELSEKVISNLSRPVSKGFHTHLLQYSMDNNID